MVSSHTGFYGLGIAPHFLEALAKMKFHTPTPIQEKAIPLAIEGKDIVGIAQTGTGKTFAFGIPMMQRIAQKSGKGLVLAPTRELATQIHKSFHSLNPKIKMALLIGGASMHNQIQSLKQNPSIFIATPGRLLDHLKQGYVSLKGVNILVLDEADRMLDMGFAPQINAILRSLPHDRQTLFFSATMPPEIMKMASNHMKLPLQVEIAKSGKVADRITQELFIVSQESKKKLLEKLLVQYRGTILLFVRTKIGAQKLTRFIRGLKHNVAEIHSDRSFNQRREALEGFKAGKFRILVATDIAARGIDVCGVELVLNFDLPDDSENYVHRVGRTARAGNPGHAISFATPDQRQDVQDIEKVMRSALPVSKHHEMPVEQFVQTSPKVVFSNRRGRTRRLLR